MLQNIFRDDLKKKMQEAVQTVKTTAQSTVEVISENAAKSAENVKASFEKRCVAANAGRSDFSLCSLESILLSDRGGW